MAMSGFTHLHVHSHYSLLDGLGKLDPLLARAKELGMTSLALTDHGAMYGAIEFYRAAQAAGIKPIIGMEAYLAPNGHTQKRGKIDSSPRHLTLLAHTTAGYKNLLKLNTHAQLQGYYYKPRIDYDLLREHQDGLIVLSGCLNSDISKAIVEKRPADAERLITWHLEIFGRERFYLEVQHHPHLAEQQIVNEALINYGKRFRLRLVATADTHYIHPADAEAHDVLICVQTGKTVQDKDRLCMLDDDFSLKTTEEMKDLWREHPEAIDSTQAIAEMCDVKLEFGVNRLPRFPLPAGRTADQALREQCLGGLQGRYGDRLPEAVHERLDYELEVIQKTGYASYFLIVADFVNEAKRRGILVGPGRGSAAGSLVSYLTNITNLDPLAYNLLFERFLNPERVSMPDIDLDFADDRRDEIISYVRGKYGSEHVAQIITFGTMAARAAVRDAGRALGFPYTFCDRIAKAIPLFTNFEEALSSGELKELYDGDPQAKRLIDTARRLEGVCRHASTHAAGVVITDEPLTEYVPLQLSTTGDNETDAVTQYAMGSVEALGLLKIDFLGLKNLTIIQNTLDRIKKRYDQNIDIDQLPLDDSLAYKLLQEGKTTGVFQLESAGMKRYLKELKPTEFEDIISMVALYRPGPMDSIPDFIAAKHGRKKITYLHPILQPILEKTYGIIVTQDQVLQIAREFAGFSYAQADILRKAVGKKIKALLDEQREKFIHGALQNKKIDKKTAQKVWDFIEPFARYGFNRAHAACYAMIAYQTAYLKAHYPGEFMAALLTSDEGNIDRAAIEIAEALSMNLQILPPDINESDHSFTVVATPEKKDALRFGLGAIKNVGHTVVEAVIAERTSRGKFKDVADLFSRMNSKDFNRKSVESLARAGAFDSISERQLILTNIEKLLEFNRALHRERDIGQKGLFGSVVAAPEVNFRLDPAAPADQQQRLKWEKELLGMYVSAHPLAELAPLLAQAATPLLELPPGKSAQRVRVAGVVGRISKIMTKSNQPMVFATIEDVGGSGEIVVFPKVLQQSAELWYDGALVFVEGKLNEKDGETKILADKVWPLTAEILKRFKTSATSARLPAGALAKAGQIRSIVIRLPHNYPAASLKKLQQALAQGHTPGGVPVELSVPHEGQLVRVATPHRLTTSGEALTTIRQLVGHTSVTYA
jgi:DNA polymerase-3 subunit alpha